MTADASGLRVPTDGSAALEVRICAPALGYGASGHQPGRLLARLGDDLVDDSKLSRWASLRDVSFAGSFEGQTKIALGVSAELSFRVSTIEECVGTPGWSSTSPIPADRGRRGGDRGNDLPADGPVGADVRYDDEPGAAAGCG